MSAWRRCACSALLLSAGMTFMAGGCGDDTAASAGGSAHGTGGTGGGGGAIDYDAGPPETPSGYLLIPATRWETLRGEVAAGGPAWHAMRSNVDAELDSFDEYRTGPENIALVYLLTGDARYAQAAYQWADDIMESAEVRFDSYLNFGDILRKVAMVLNYCGVALDAAQRSKMVSYLDRWTNELWFENDGSGWGLEDPGNNYHMAFLEGTAFAGYALREAGHANGQKYIDVLLDKIEKPGGVLEYLGTRARGGDWPEGTNYGQRSKRRLFSALSVIASMGGPVFFRASPFFAENLYYTYFQIQPGGGFICPTGDVARDSSMPLTPYEREIVQMSTFWMRAEDEAARAFGRWFLANVVSDYTGPNFDHRPAYFQDVLYAVEGGQRGPDELGLMHHAVGNGWVNVRSSWASDATSLTVLGAPVIDQSHAHYDVGSFLLWKHDWQAVDPVTYSDAGLCWDSGAHNMVHVESQERRGGDSPGLAKLEHNEAFTYFQIDATQTYRIRPEEELLTMMEEVTRELLYLPPNTLVVYDRVEPKPAGSDYDFRVHFATRPVESGGQFSAQHGGGGISLRVLQGGSASILSDEDLVGGGGDAWRVQVAPTGASSRFLAVVQVASGSAPAVPASALQTDGDAQGALWEDHAVVFSSRRRGEPAALPFSYTANSGNVRAHTLVNMGQPCDVTVSTQGESTTVTVSPGTKYQPSQNGVVHFEG